MNSTATSKHTLTDVINELSKKKLAFAFFKLPHQTDTCLMAADIQHTHRCNINFDVLKSGFAFAPFDEQQSPYFIEAQYQTKINNFRNIDLPQPLELEHPKIQVPSKFEARSEIENLRERDSYILNLKNVIRDIQNGEAQKVVLSRKVLIAESNISFLAEAFENLTKKQNEALISLVYIPSVGQYWLGASPEILVQQDKKGIFSTISLAGTQSALDVNGKEINPVKALWSHKEIEEQALVSRYIINCLKQIRIREFEEHGPKTVKAGHLLHLKSTFTINLNKICFEHLSATMLTLLHPTSAVCGMPKNKAIKIIHANEYHERTFYAGYLGPVNFENQNTIFVNIRCVMLMQKHLYAFVGSGLTEDSCPENEWEETQLKLQSILKDLN